MKRTHSFALFATALGACAVAWSEVGVTGEIEVADHSSVNATPHRLQFVDDLQCARLRRTGERAGGEGRPEHVDGVRTLPQVALDSRHEMHDMAEALDPHELGHRDGACDADLREVVARQVDEHEVLGALLGTREQVGLVLHVGLRRCTARQ